MFSKANKIIIFVCISALVLVLPVHSLITTFAINNLNFPVSIVLWKELFSIILIGSLAVDVFVSIRAKKKQLDIAGFLPVILYVLLVGWVVVISALNQIQLSSYVYGLRFELWWVGILALGLTWRYYNDFDNEHKTIKRLFAEIIPLFVLAGLGTSLLVSLGIYFLGQTEILASWGYGVYNGDAAYLNPVLCHRIDALSDTCRLSGGFTLPNHYAGYLLLGLGYLLYYIRSREIQNRVFEWLLYAMVPISLLTIFLTYSRFALLGSVVLATWLVGVSIVGFSKRSGSFGFPAWLKKTTISCVLLIPALIGIIGINLPGEKLQDLPQFIGKPYSTDEHYRRTMANLEIIDDNAARALVGYGIGTSGPAAKPEYIDVEENPLYEPYFDQKNAQYYLGNGLFVPENWYLQLILNGGIMYGTVYVLLIGIPFWIMIWRIIKAKPESLDEVILEPKNFIAVGLYTIMLGNLFLHIWENQTVAIVYALMSLVDEI